MTRELISIDGLEPVERIWGASSCSTQSTRPPLHGHFPCATLCTRPIPPCSLVPLQICPRILLVDVDGIEEISLGDPREAAGGGTATGRCRVASI